MSWFAWTENDAKRAYGYGTIAVGLSRFGFMPIARRAGFPVTEMFLITLVPAVARLTWVLRRSCNMESPILFDFFPAAMALTAICSLSTTSCNSVLHRENMAVKRIGKGCRSLIEFTKQVTYALAIGGIDPSGTALICCAAMQGESTRLGFFQGDFGQGPLFEFHFGEFARHGATSEAALRMAGDYGDLCCKN